MWQSPSDVFTLTLTPAEAAEVADVLDLAAGFAQIEPAARGNYLAMARAATSARARRLAAQTTSRSDPHRPALRTFFGALCATAPNAPLWTKHGWFSDADLAGAGARVPRENGREIILFPVRIRDGQAVYRRQEERSARLDSFTVKPGSGQPTQVSWWQTEPIGGNDAVSSS